MSTPTAEHAVVEAVPTQLYIGGEWRDAAEGGTLAVEDPSTGQTLTEVADATLDDAKTALGAAPRRSPRGATARPATAPTSCTAPSA